MEDGLVVGEDARGLIPFVVGLEQDIEPAE